MSEELQIVPIEEQISQELIKQNVTATVIAGLKDKYGHLKISGIEDRETYDLVKTGRKECKSFRVLAKKICEKGREDAVAIQKAWVAKQKEVTDQIAAIEDPLEEQEKAYEAAVAKEKEDRKRKQEEQLIMRQQILTGMGALYSDGSFHLGEVSFELSLVKESEPDIWEETIMPKFKEEYEKVEAERIEQERIKKEQELEFQRKELEQEKKRLELEAKELALKRAEEEQDRKRKEEEEKKLAEIKAAEQAKMNTRIGQLKSIGLRPDMQNGHMYYTGFDCAVSHLDITGYDDDRWGKMIEDMSSFVTNKKAEAEQKRLAEIEGQKEAERKKAIFEGRKDMLDSYGYDNISNETLASCTDDEWDGLLSSAKEFYEEKQKLKWEKEQEEKRKQEQLLEQQRMDQAKDKEKWSEIIRRVNEIEVYEMKSSQYRKKAMILREKLEEIKSL